MEQEIVCTYEESKSKYPPAPKGLHSCVCVDIQDLGMQPGYEGKLKHKIKIVWQIAPKRQDGKNHILSGWYTLSLFPGANLRKLLESWRGDNYTQAEMKAGPQLRKEYIGRPGLMQVTHDVKTNGDVKAKVYTVLPLPDNMEPLVAEPYVRKEKSEDKDVVPF